MILARIVSRPPFLLKWVNIAADASIPTRPLRRDKRGRSFPPPQGRSTVIGVSGDDIETLSKFSVQACQNKFPVASDEKQSVMKSYDAVMKTRPEYANRISYVIAPDGSIAFQYMSLNPTKHVEKTLDALKSWSATKK